MNGSQFWSLYSAYNQMYSSPQNLNEEYEDDIDEGFKPTSYNNYNYLGPFHKRSRKAEQILAQIEKHKRQGNFVAAHNIDFINRIMDEPESRRESITKSQRNKYKLDRQARRDAQRDEKAYRKGKTNIKDSYDYDLYDLVLEYLLDEGLCESVENAEIMMAHMSEEWVDAIVEGYHELLEGFKDLTPEKEERVADFLEKQAKRAKEIIKTHRELSRKPFARFRPGIKQQKAELAKEAKKIKELSSNVADAAVRTAANRQAARRAKINSLKDMLAGRNNIRGFYREDLEYVLEYLIDEGYTDSYESALVILETMSEQWIDSIVEGYQLDENTEEIARLRAQMKIALQKGDKESIKSISTRMAEIQPKAQAKIGAVLRGLKPRKR